MTNSLQAELAERRAHSLYRTRIAVEARDGVELSHNGRNLLNFCSNDYLGLAGHPDLSAAMQAGIECWGVGSGAAHLVTGHTRAHHALEEELAEFTGRSKALLFSTGYMANMGVIDALFGRGDTLYLDRLNHASLIDAGRLSRAKLKRYPHLDLARLHHQMQQQENGKALVVTDGVFSMDGDLAPLSQLSSLCAEKGAWLMVDDAHGLGVLGANGGGTLETFGLGIEEVPILMGTLGKALGTFGAFVAGSEELIETLIQKARSYIYTTAPPPAIAEATRAALRLVQQEGWRRERLRDLIDRFRRGADQLGIPLMRSDTPIQPILACSAKQALAWSAKLEQRGIWVSAIRPPTVPEGEARLRVTLSAAHSDEQLEQLLEALAGLPIGDSE